MDLALKTTTFPAQISFLDSKEVRYIRGGLTIDASVISADEVTGLKKLLAGTIVGLSGGKVRKYVAAVKASRVTGVEGNNNAILWTAKLAGVAGNAIRTAIVDTGINGQALEVLVANNTVIVNAARGAGVQASLNTGVVGNNNAITWTAKLAGTAGNAIEVALIDPAGNDQPLEVKLVNDEIRVYLATSGAGAITSTAAQVIAAVNDTLLVKDLVEAANTGASTGAAAVVAAAAAPLANGADGVITSTAAQVIAAVNAAIDNTFVDAANEGDSTGAAAVVADAATVLANGAAANVIPKCLLAEDVLCSQFTESGGLTHSDKIVTGIDGGRVITSRLPEAPDDYVKACLPAITFA
jgi:hypothetical protein